MFIVSMKVTKSKIAAVCIAIAVFVGIGVTSIVTGQDSTPTAAPKGDVTAKTEGEMIGFLKEFGWETGDHAVEIVEVTIPKEFDDVYTKYNAIQKKQGYDLKKYSNKRVVRYTFDVSNYPDQPDVKANVLVYKEKIIGGDICSAQLNGFMHGFALESTAENTTDQAENQDQAEQTQGSPLEQEEGQAAEQQDNTAEGPQGEEPQE